MNSRIGISTGCRNSCGTISGRDSSTLKFLAKGSFEAFQASSYFCFYILDDWGYLRDICTLG